MEFREPFPKVLTQFTHRLPSYNKWKARFLQKLGVTKTIRTPYDHYMLNLHDSMKKDDLYQQNADKSQFEFAPGSTWIVFTDQVSHAALSGQYLLEQTFYLPVEAMANPKYSPLQQLEHITSQKLI